MDLQELKHIERAMELIENRDEDFRNNNLWQKLKEAENIWYEKKRTNNSNFICTNLNCIMTLNLKRLQKRT